MIKKFLVASIYSTGLSCYCFSMFPKEYFTYSFDKSLAIIGFWNIFMVPVGTLWSQVNEKVVKTLGYHTFQMRRAYTNKIYLMIDVLLNHVLYQIIFVGAFYNYLNWFFPNDKIFAYNRRKNEGINQTVANPLILLSDLTYARVKLTIISCICDIWITRKDDIKAMNVMRTKTLAINVVWHLYVIYKYFVNDEKNGKIKGN